MSEHAEQLLHLRDTGAMSDAMKRPITSPITNHVRVLILADDPLARAGLAALLDATPPVDVAGQSSSDVDLTALLAAFQPDALLWDLGWTPDSQIAVLSQFVEERAVPVVALLATPALAGAARAAGARGLLSRGADGAHMAAALAAVAHGLLVFDETLLPAQASLPTDMELVEPLSNRELEVLRHLAEGLSNKEIARSLGISENTVKFHVNAILGKVGAQSRTEAVVRATRAGLLLL